MNAVYHTWIMLLIAKKSIEEHMKESPVSQDLKSAKCFRETSGMWAASYLQKN